jgi:mediator of RNA polymerase II transcription subunit 12
MICYPGGLPSVLQSEDDDDDDEPEQRRHITRILKHVDQWSQRVSWLELQLMLKQALQSVCFILVLACLNIINMQRILS